MNESKLSYQFILSLITASHLFVMVSHKKFRIVYELIMNSVTFLNEL